MPDDGADPIGAFVRRVLTGETEQSPLAQVFYAVRNVPYATDAAHDALGLIRHRRGDCVAKSDLLSRSLRLLGRETRTVRWLYRLPLYPPEVQLLPTLMDIHTAVQMHGPDGWTLVDATHDPALAGAGLIVNEWDGCSGTAPAYEASGPMWPEDDPEIDEALRTLKEAYVGRSHDAALYRTAFNHWLDSFRVESP